MSDREDTSAVQELTERFNRLIPFADSDAHLTIKHVFLNTEYRYLKLFVDEEKAVSTQDLTPGFYLDYLTHNSHWSLYPLVEQGYSLRLVVFVKGDKSQGISPGDGMYNYNAEVLKDAISPAHEDFAQLSLLDFVQARPNVLSIRMQGGETWVSTTYNSDSMVVTNTYDCPDTLYGFYREWVSDNDFAFLLERITLWMYDTSYLGAMLYKSTYSMDEVFRNQSHTDSVRLRLSPWMFGDQYLAWRVDPLISLQMSSRLTKAECPMVVDAFTTLTDCTVDMDSVMFIYHYEVDDTVMQMMKNNPEMVVSFKESLWQGLQTDDGMELLDLLVSASASLRYVYSPKTSSQPLVITFDYDQLQALVDTWVEDSAARLRKSVAAEGGDLMAELVKSAYNASSVCPYQLDEYTTLTACSMDTVNLIYTFHYDVTEMAMLMMENNPQGVEKLRQALVQQFQTADDKAFLNLLVQGRVLLQYVYKAKRSPHPIVISFTFDELEAIRRSLDGAGE